MPRKLTLNIRDANDNSWRETYLENDARSFTDEDTDLQKWSENLINEFNAALRPGESTRTLDSIEVVPMTLEELQEVAELYADEDDDVEDDEDEDDLDEDEDDDDLDEDEDLDEDDE